MGIRAGTEIVLGIKINQFQVLATVTSAEGSRNERKHLIIKAALYVFHVVQSKHSTGTECGKRSDHLYADNVKHTAKSIK